MMMIFSAISLLYSALLTGGCIRGLLLDNSQQVIIVRFAVTGTFGLASLLSMLIINYLGRKTLQMIGFGMLMVLHLTIGVLKILNYD